MTYDVQLTATQWAQLSAWIERLMDYQGNGLAFLVWGVLGILFCLALLFYMLLRRPRR